MQETPAQDQASLFPVSVELLGLWVQALGSRVQCLAFRVQGFIWRSFVPGSIRETP